MGSPYENFGEGKSKKAIDSANSATEAWKKNILDIEESVTNIHKMWKEMGGSGATGESGGKFNSDLSAGIEKAKARLDEMMDRPRTKMDTLRSVGNGALSVAAFGYGMLPNTMEAVSQRIQAQGVASMTGMSAQGLIRSSNALIGGGMTGPSSAQGAMAALAGSGILPTMGSYSNIMGQVGGYSVLTGQSNEQVAAGFGSINGMNFMRAGIRARDAKGNLRSGSDIGNDLYRRLYGANKNVTVENAAQVYNPNSKAYQSVMAVAGGNQELFTSLAANLVFQAKNKGQKLDMSAENVKNNILNMPADDPMRKWYNYQQSEGRKLEVSGKGLVQGYGAALDATSAVNNGFAELAKVLPGVVDNLGRLKGLLTTLPQAGTTGAALSGFGGALAGNAAAYFRETQKAKVLNTLLGGAAETAAAAEAGAAGAGAGATGAGAAATGGAVASAIKAMTTKGTRLAGLRAFAGTATGRIGLGLAAGVATNWAVPRLRDFGRNTMGVKAGSGFERGATIAAYAGGYAAAGALIGGPVGAVIGTGVGIFKGWAESSKHAHDQDLDTGGDVGNPWLMSTIKQAGFGPRGAEIAYAVAMAESGGNINAHNTNASTGDNSYGLFQINMIGDLGPGRRKQYGLKNNNQLFNALTNAKIAYQMSNKGRDWGAWSTYKNGAYKKFLHNEPRGASSGNTKNNARAQHGGLAGGTSQPSDGPVTAVYGQKPKNNSYWKWKGYHTGTDYGLPKGSTVRAVKEGIVKATGPGSGIRGVGEPYGNVVLIDHGDGYDSLYAHLTSATVKKGQHVKAGQQIALSGQTGSGAKGPHLHFEVRKGMNPLDPAKFLNGTVGKTGGGGLLGSIKKAVGGIGRTLGKAFDWLTGDNESDSQIGSFTKSGPGASSHPIFSVSMSGVVGNKDTRTASLLGYGGDTGAPTGIAGGSSSGGVVIHMNVTVHGTSTQDARKFANDVKNMLEKDLRASKIGSY